MTKKNIQKRSEWKMDTPTPYGLQDGSPKQLVPPKGSDWERIDGGSVAGNGVGVSSSASSAGIVKRYYLVWLLRRRTGGYSRAYPRGLFIQQSTVCYVHIHRSIKLNNNIVTFVYLVYCSCDDVVCYVSYLVGYCLSQLSQICQLKRLGRILLYSSPNNSSNVSRIELIV